MRHAVAAFTLFITAAFTLLVTEASSQSSTTRPTFDVVSIRRTPPNEGRSGAVSSPLRQRPDGGFTMANVVVGTLISRAYPPAIPKEMVGLPDWARREGYDVSATSSLALATPADRIAMLRAMLAERFKLAVRFEKREQPAFALVLARGDGKLGSGLKPTEFDCAVRPAPSPSNLDLALNAGPLPDFKAAPPRCTLRILDRRMRDRSGDGLGRSGDLLEGEATVADLAAALRPLTGRFVVDKTGLRGSYAVRLNFDQSPPLAGSDPAQAPASAPSLFTAVREQLGLRLEPARAERDVLMIEHLERPTEN